ncbi:MAG: XRE family transcriptional regulator [Acidobacteria bacterium]|nr:XRE family transcriptional regulator [Acidobacteriota bacterium]
MPEESAIAANVARLRLDRRLTQAALAERAGLTRVALGKIERGAVLPRAGTLAALAGALRVPVRDLVARVRPLRSVRFRAHSTMYGREQTLAEVSRWLEAYGWLEGELGETREFLFRGLVANEGPRSPIEVAAAARNVARIEKAPVPNICRLLEDCGVKVLLLDSKRESFFGLSVGREDGGPAVVVNVWDRISVERWIFTAAHELGHLLLHPHEFEREATDLPEKTEREADAFASEFLMPESAFEVEWDATDGYPLLWRVLAVKRVFRVSYKTVLLRLVKTEREGSEVWGAFQRQHRNRFGRTLKKEDEPKALQKSEFAWKSGRAGEPAALSEHDFRRDRLARLVRRAIEDGHISLSRGAEVLDMPLEDMRGWARDWAG